MEKIQGNKTLVTIIRTSGKSALVQYVAGGELSRKFIPSSEVVGNFVSDDVLEYGIQYGFPWGDIELKFDTACFANEMRNLDLWTVQDVMRSPQKLWSALRAALSDNLSNILEIAKNETKGER